MSGEGTGTPATARGRAASPRPSAWLPRILLESLLIVLSVLVALGVDEWRDERRRVERSEVAMQSIRAELEENRSNVASARAGHLAMRDSLATYARADQLPPDRLYLYGIFNPALVHTAAWDSARETGATSEMPYELVLRLSRVYDHQERYRTLGERLVQDIMTDVRRQGTGPVMQEGFRGFMTLQEDFSGRERTLLEEYEQALVALDGGGALPPRSLTPDEHGRDELAVPAGRADDVRVASTR